MVVAMTHEATRLIGAAVITGWGLLAMTMGSLLWTNFGGVADLGVRMARWGRGLEEAHRRNTVRAYRRYGGWWVAFGAAAVVCGLLGFLWAVG
jgi:hypothetical protein